ncbi:hypothetical protein Hanom_Chr02g00117391 [Helianthus anomalus]
MPLSRLEPSTSRKRWVSVANWATSVVSWLVMGLGMTVACVS